MTELIIIGNGFDLAHDMKTAYSDYIRAMLLDALSDAPQYRWTSPFYLGTNIIEVLRVKGEYKLISEIERLFNEPQNSGEKIPEKSSEQPRTLTEIYRDVAKARHYSLSPLVSLLIKDFEQKGWVDLEQSYFDVLCKSYTDREAVMQLNSDLDLLQKSLSSYLREEVSSPQEYIRSIKEYLDELAHITLEQLKRIKNTSNTQIIEPSEVKKELKERKNKAFQHKFSLKEARMEKSQELKMREINLKTYKKGELKARADLRNEQELGEDLKTKRSKDLNLQSLVIKKIEDKIQYFREEIDRTEKEIDNIKQEIKDIDLRIKDIEQQIEDIKQRLLNLQNTKLVVLNFNYTSTIGLYLKEEDEYISIPIHGTLEKNDIVLGYGDETCEMYKTLENVNDNELLKYFKSFNYMQNSRYRDLEHIISSDKFRIHIMGHSCGLSDKVLLSHLFNHKNLDTIRIYYYDEGEGKNDFFEKCQNISRLAIDKHRIRYKILPPSQDHTDMERSVALVPFWWQGIEDSDSWEALPEDPDE